MPRKQLTFLVVAIFTLVAIGAFLGFRRGAEVDATLANLQRDQLVGVRFVKDPLRESEGLDLAVEADDDLEALLAALHTLRASGRSIKSLDVLTTTTIALTLASTPASEDTLTLSVMRAAQTGEVGVVSIMRGAGPGEVSAGVFDSAELLAWVEQMASKPGFESIAEIRR